MWKNSGENLSIPGENVYYIYFRKYPAVRGTPANFEINSEKVLRLGGMGCLGCVGLSAESERVKYDLVA